MNFLKCQKNHGIKQKKIKFFTKFLNIINSFKKENLLKNIFIVYDKNRYKSFFVDKNYLIKNSKFVFLRLLKI